MIGNALFVVLMIPALILATLQYGVIGAGYAWLTANVVYFLLWVPKVHGRFVKGLHAQWLIRDVGPIGLLTLLAAALAHGWVTWPPARVPVVIWIGVVSVALLVIAAAGSSWMRETTIRKWRAGKVE